MIDDVSIVLSYVFVECVDREKVRSFMKHEMIWIF